MAANTSPPVFAYTTTLRVPALPFPTRHLKTSYYWRKVLPLLTTCVVLDMCSIGGSTQPDSGYDMRTVASDLVELMTARLR